MSLESVHTLLTLAFGFSVAGMLASFYQLVTTRPPSFTLLRAQARALVVAVLPFLILTAPFIIMRNIIRGRQMEGRNFGYTMLATMIAGFWSLLSGTLLVTTFELLGLMSA
jgi:O-antigen/teichoic acid export membrane protein